MSLPEKVMCRARVLQGADFRRLDDSREVTCVIRLKVGGMAARGCERGDGQTHPRVPPSPQPPGS